MPPSRVRAAAGGAWEDSESHDKEASVSATLAGPLQRKKNGVPVSGPSRQGIQLNEVVKTAAQEGSNAVSTSSTTEAGGTAGSQWSTFPPFVLRKYKHYHRLAVPTCFGTTRNELTLLTPGISDYAPSRARIRHRQRVTRETMAKAIRKDFNAMAATEMDVVTNYLYTIKHENKPLRMRFGSMKDQNFNRRL